MWPNLRRRRAAGERRRDRREAGGLSGECGLGCRRCAPVAQRVDVVVVLRLSRHHDRVRSDAFRPKDILRCRARGCGQLSSGRRGALQGSEFGGRRGPCGALIRVGQPAARVRGKRRSWAAGAWIGVGDWSRETSWSAVTKQTETAEAGGSAPTQRIVRPLVMFLASPMESAEAGRGVRERDGRERCG